MHSECSPVDIILWLSSNNCNPAIGRNLSLKYIIKWNLIKRHVCFQLPRRFEPQTTRTNLYEASTLPTCHLSSNILWKLTICGKHYYTNSFETLNNVLCYDIEKWDGAHYWPRDKNILDNIFTFYCYFETVSWLFCATTFSFENIIDYTINFH